MTNEQTKQFYSDIADVCKKHNISGIVGPWWGGDGDDSYGYIKYWDITSTDMKRVVDALAEKFEEWERELLGREPITLGEIREVRGRGKEPDNN